MTRAIITQDLPGQAIDGTKIVAVSSLGGTVDGSGAATRIAYWSDANTLTSNSSLTFDGNAIAVPTDVFAGGIVEGLDIQGAGGGTFNGNFSTMGFFGATPAAQPAAQADASGGAVIDAEARTALNGLLAKLRTLGIIDT